MDPEIHIPNGKYLCHSYKPTLDQLILGHLG